MRLTTGRSAFIASGEPLVWLTAGALALSVLMVVGLLALILGSGLGFFWPRSVTRLTLDDGSVVLGEVAERETVPGTKGSRLKIKQGNRDITGVDFVWVDQTRIKQRAEPPEAVVLERREWGTFFGTLSEAGWKALQDGLPAARDMHRKALRLEKGRMGKINYQKDRIRVELRRLERKGVSSGAAVDTLKARSEELDKLFQAAAAELEKVRASAVSTAVLKTADGSEKEIPLAAIVRAYRPNRMGAGAKAALYASRLWEFVSAEPRESNTEGGVFPAIFGTVMMVMIMSVVVTPLGVLAAFYLREYARQGALVSAVRIAVNNLAGVPSIVFGVFGLGFFVYFLGGSIDRLLFAESLPTPTFGTGGILWASLTLSLLTVPVVIVAAEEGLAAIPRGVREASYALGVTKLETMSRVVLPAVMPAILTGLILAMARAAGEVAPLMITGVVKLAPALPLDGVPPFLHLDRKFMHLGFHIYDVGFQSPNVEAARPMVFTTTILLLLIVVALNLTAVIVRNRLRARLRTSGL